MDWYGIPTILMKTPSEAEKAAGYLSIHIDGRSF
jgi:hypothetical protein